MQRNTSTDPTWETWGRDDPYFGVLTEARFRKQQLTRASKEEFFESGEQHVARVLETCRRQLDPGFSPEHILDFGCGVGRFVIPFAKFAQHVVGLDVSDSMLTEAALNCGEQALVNVTLCKSDDTLGELEGEFDLIHSYIVFQHIPLDRGRRLFLGLLRHLGPGGIGVLHFTYWTRSPAPDGASVASLLGHRVRKRWNRARRSLRKLADRLRSSGVRDPGMQLNAYDLNVLLLALQSLGISRIYTEFTNHGGKLGLILYFQRPAH